MIGRTRGSRQEAFLDFRRRGAGIGPESLPPERSVHMVALTSLWLPIVLSAVATFLAGFVLWVVLPHHKSDWSPLPDEDAAMAALRPQGLAPGMYHMPHAGHDAKPQKNPEWVAKVEAGPSAFVVVMPKSTMLDMGPTLGKNFAYLLLMGLMVAYVGSATLPAGTEYLKVFQVTGTVALIGHSMGAFPKAIFWGWSRSAATKEVLDGLVYALVTAGVFGWLWPS